MTLSPAAGGEVRWWIAHVAHSQKFLHAPPLNIIIYSDASLEGWGATDSISTVGAPWQVADALLHINVLKLTAAHFALLHLAADARGIHIQLKLDNLAVVAYINRMGGTHSPECNQVAQQIWEWAVERGIWLSAAYIPGVSNVVADFHSRCFHENKEWALQVSVFDLLSPTYGSPGIDLFASSRNAKLPVYISWFPDQLAYAVDALTVSWQDLNFYAFPPFSLLPRVLAKIIQDKATGILIIPLWSTQSWFPLVLTLLIHHPRVIAPCRDLLYLPQHPRGAPTTQEAAISGGAFIRDALQGFGLSQSASALIQESWRPGTRVQYDSLLRGWQGFCSQRKVHPLSPTILDVISYLTSMYGRGLQYTPIASARSVLSGFLHIPGVTSISSHPLIIRLLKGIFHVRPPKPRYEFIWGTELVLHFLKNLHPSVIGLKLLTLKTVTLLTLLSGQRVSTLHQFRLSQMQRTPTIVVFNIQGLLKQSRPTKRDLPITYHAFPS